MTSHPHASRLTHHDLLLALVAGGGAFVLYLRTLAPGLLGGDSGEFQLAAWLAGFVHPTGYPLYLILGHLWSHLLPWHDPAWRMNAFSALWGGVAVGLVYLLAARLVGAPSPALPPLRQGKGELPPLPGRGAARVEAAFAALTFAVTPTFWSQAVIAEVYTLHAVFVAAVLLAVIACSDGRRTKADRLPITAYLLAGLYGLSLTHHRAMLLLAPAIVVYWWLRWRGRARDALQAVERPSAPVQRPLRSRAAAPLLVTVSLLAPLLLYAYLPLRGPQTPYAHVRVGPGQELALYDPTPAGFLTYVTGQTFQGALGGPAEAGARLIPAAQRLVAEVTWVGIALGLVGLIALVRRNRRLLALTGLSFIAIVAFNLFYGIGDIAAFYIPAYLIWVLWMAVGVRFAVHNVYRVSYLGASFSCFLALILPACLLVTHFGPIDQSRNSQAREAWTRILAAGIPQDAILVSNDRDEMMPLWYMQQVEGARPDLTGLFPLILPEPAWADVGAVLDRSLAAGRPVWLIKAMPGLEVKARLEAAGPIVRVLGPALTAPPQQEATAAYADAIRLAGCDLAPASLAPGGQATITLRWQPLRPLGADYTTFVQLLNADGQKIGQSDHRPGGVYYPTSLWKPGETLADTHTFAVATQLGRPPYTLLVGLYTTRGDELQHLGQSQRIGEWSGAR